MCSLNPRPPPVWLFQGSWRTAASPSSSPKRSTKPSWRSVGVKPPTTAPFTESVAEDVCGVTRRFWWTQSEPTARESKRFLVSGERGGERGGGGHGRGGRRTRHEPEPRGVPGRPSVPAAHQGGEPQHAAVRGPRGRPLRPIRTLRSDQPLTQNCTRLNVVFLLLMFAMNPMWRLVPPAALGFKRPTGLRTGALYFDPRAAGGSNQFISRSDFFKIKINQLIKQ